MPWKIEFFADDEGHQPARKFLEDLDTPKRMAMIAAIECILEPHGLDVCRTEYGSQLGEGLFEFRLRHDEPTIRRKAGQSVDGAGGSADLVLRLFCHAHGDRVVLLLGGYDKGEDPSGRRQSREIVRARRHLRSFKLRHRRRATGSQRKGKR